MVRRARARDARRCIEITRQTVRERPRTLVVDEPELWDARAWWRHAVPWGSRGAALVAELDGEVVGQLRTSRVDDRTAIAHVASLGLLVAPEARDLGVGRALLEAAEAWARAHGVTRLTLEVFAGNERAKALYVKAGYVEEGFHRGAVRFPDEAIDVISMAKVLEPVAGE